MDSHETSSKGQTVKFIYSKPDEYKLYYINGAYNGLTPRSDKDEIIIVSLRELPYEDAKAEIETYIQKAGDRKVYISELAEELRLDIDLIIDILSELEEQS